MNAEETALRNRERVRDHAQTRGAEIAAELHRLRQLHHEILNTEPYTEVLALQSEGIKRKIEGLERSLGYLLYWALVYGAKNFYFDLPEDSVYPAYREVKE